MKKKRKRDVRPMSGYCVKCARVYRRPTAYLCMGCGKILMRPCVTEHRLRTTSKTYRDLAKALTPGLVEKMASHETPL